MASIKKTKIADGAGGVKKISKHQLRSKVDELDKIAKQLVKRDLELSQVREKQEAQMVEMDRIAKMLVRRDFELLQANETLRELDSAKSQFVSIAAHQLRTPLSGIKWLFKMLLAGDYGDLNSDQKEVVERGYQMVIRMISLVSDLLDVARIESGKIEYHFQKMDIAEIVAGLAQEQEKIIKKEGANVLLGITGACGPLFADVDKERLSMALRNLLDNAVKYSRAGGVVNISVAREEAFAMIEIKDGGIGISESDIPKLFGKFFRGENASGGQLSGTGLGLFIAKSIVGAHDGTLTVESKLGQGSSFVIKLPLDRPQGPSSISNMLYVQ